MAADDRDGTVKPGPVVVEHGPGKLEPRVRLLSDVLGAFAEATTDYDELLHVISRKLADVVGDLCTVMLLSPDGASMAIVAMHDNDARVMAIANETFDDRTMMVVPVQQRVLETGEALLVPSVSPNQVRQTTTDKRAEFTARIGMRSVLLVALRARGEAIGLLNLVRHRRDRGEYDTHDRDLAQQLADHAAVAIANARLLQKRHGELRRAYEQVRAANRELEAFSYSVAHDLRAPLRSIDGFAAALDDDYGDKLDDQGRDYLARVRAGSRRMGQLIDDLLSLAHISRTPISRRHIDVTDMVHRIAGEVASRSPERAVALHVATGMTANADPRLLQIVFENLLGNAWKFTSKLAAAAVDVGIEQRDDEVVFFVRDNGAGFDGAQVDRLFAPFQRLHTDAEFDGTGIGLATVQRIVARHGGSVWAEAELGAGATFRFTLT